jgi:hypothetical protein
MKDLKLIRKDINANTIEHFGFDVDGFEFLVKNFNDFDIYIAFKETDDTDEMIKIPAESSQICMINKGTSLDNSSRDIYVYAEDSGEVEVQCIKY